MKFEPNVTYFIDRSDENAIEVYKRIKDNLKELNQMYLDQNIDMNKVAFYYEDKKGNIFSYNKSVLFYAASSIKIVTCLLTYKMAEEGKLDLSENILVTLDDLKPDTGIIKNNTEDKYYTIDELIKLCIVESDNTAYLKLVDIVGGKDKVEEFGKSLGATHTMEGKDSFGLTNCEDMIIYWKAIKDYIETGKYGQEFKEYLSNPSLKLIEDDSISGNYVRKYGSWDIAYHETGYVETENEYYLIVLTQLYKKDYKEEFINKTAKLLDEINKNI